MKKLTLLILVLSASCAKIVTWDDLSLQKIPYNGNQLRVDGYYYQIEDDMYNSAYCLYRDGCLLNMGGYESSLEKMDYYIEQEFFNKSYASKKQYWGVFTIMGETIRFERYYITDDIRKRSYIREGTISNDSTFHIIVSYRSDGSERKERDEIYRFRQFVLKPDSTNNYVK